MLSRPPPSVREPPLYRPFALIALAATLLVGTPLGSWMLARLHWGGGPVSAEQVWLHAHFQVFIEGSPVPWPRLRGVAFWVLVGSVLIRTAEILADYDLEAILPLVPLSGVLAWIALACLGAGVLGAMRHRRAV